MYKPYEKRVYFVAISDADRHPDLAYAATIHHGIRFDHFPLDPAGSDDLVFFGRIHPDKGAREAIAVARAAERRLHIYGVVQDEAYHRDHVLPAVDGEQIFFHGAVGGADRARALGGAHALLHLINFDEPFGLSVVEAMACGTPVIAVRRGSMAEIVEDGLTGFLVEDEAGAVAAVRRTASLDRGTICANTRARFSAERMADDYIALYERILR
jgi:glycosyltransferase involved in cell wall biosynthesis